MNEDDPHTMQNERLSHHLLDYVLDLFRTQLVVPMG